MNIQEYKDKVEWYFREEYSTINIEDTARGSDELSEEIDNLIETAYKKDIHLLVRRKPLLWKSFAPLRGKIL